MKSYKYKNIQIKYVDEGDGEVIVLLPGNTASSAVHGGEISFFSSFYRVLCPDYIGYGKSDRVEKFSKDFFFENAKMIGELTKSLGIREYNVIGTSGGGIMALNVSIQYPGVVKSVVADSIPGEWISAEYARKVASERNQNLDEQIEFWRFAHGDDWESVINMDTEMILEQAESGESLYGDRLTEIDCPVLITASLQDDEIENIEEKHKNICSQIKNVKTYYHKDGSHPLMWSRPEIFREYVMNFLKSTSS
ncbi:MAG: alpha/beta hydrolase [Caldisericia bacterium]